MKPHICGHIRQRLLGAALAASSGLGVMRREDEPTYLQNTQPGRGRYSTLLTPSVASMEAYKPSPDTKPSRTLVFDFVILGNGNAGQSAVKTLQKQCPGAKIALVDPLRPLVMPESPASVDYLPQSATGFRPSSRTVQLSDPNLQLQYKHGLLVATGSRGAPPPVSLFDPVALDRVLELRPTEQLHNGRRPVLAPATVRHLTLMAASQGATVGILGSGWEAVELATAAAAAGSNKSSVLAFGSAGPLSAILPRYLSTEVGKRLRQQGIETLERSLVRYVAQDRQNASVVPRLELHTAKSYDLLDTSRRPVDLLVLAPIVLGPRGTAVLPTGNIPSDLQLTQEKQPWFQAWSQVTCPAPDSPSTISCHGSDGRIMVNAELSAASRIYAAGSVAKLPSSVTGHLHVAGQGTADGARAGKCAALRMARDYHERSGSIGNDDCSVQLFSAESLPIWRSDECVYLHGEDRMTDTLERIGIKALCVGQCDSTRFSTHGYWWTNRRAMEQSYYESSTYERHKTRRRRTRSSAQPLPVFGTGIVFYLDSTGCIVGVMTWGLPFTAKTEERDGSQLNPALLDHIKGILGKSVGLSQWEPEGDAFLRRNALMMESKSLIGTALSKSLTRRNTSRSVQNLMVPVEAMGTPLYRYTAAKPPRISSIGILKRKDNSRFGELMGENIYVKDDIGDPAPLGGKPTMAQNAPWAEPRDEEYRQEKLEALRQENDQRARPPKEEPLWLRRGESHKGINIKEVMMQNFLTNMREGRFSDGRESVQQAPVPRVVGEVKETVRGWMGSSDKENDESEEEESSNPEED